MLRSFFHKHNSRSEEKIQERIKAIRDAKPLTEDAADPLLHATAGSDADRALRSVQSSIARYDERIKVVFAGHAKAQVFASFPGVGPVFGPRLAAAFGTSTGQLPRR